MSPSMLPHRLTQPAYSRMKIDSELRSASITTGRLWDLLIWAAVLAIVFLAYSDAIKFSTPTLTACFFVAFGIIIFLKWLGSKSNAKDMRNFIYLGVLFWVLLDPLQMREGIGDFDDGVVAETLVYVAIFLMTVSLGYQLPRPRIIAKAFARISEPAKGKRIYRATIVLFLIGLIPILYYSEGSASTFRQILLAGYDWEVDAGWRRSALGSGLDYLFTIFFLILNATPFLALWAFKRASLNLLQKAILSSIILSVPLFFFFSGSRRTFAFLVLGLLFYLYNAIPAPRRKRWGILFALAPLVLLLAMQVQVQYRTEGFHDIDLATVETRFDHLQRDDIFYWMLTAVNVMPEQYPFTREVPFADLFIHPIPRSLWPDKPVTEGFPFLNWRDYGATLTISIIGQFYVAQGLLGVIMAGLCFGWAARNWDQLIQTASDGSVRSLIYYMGGILFFVVGIRNFGEIVTQWYSVGFLVLVFYFLGRSKAPSRVAGLVVRRAA